MDISVALATDLAALTEILDHDHDHDHDYDLETELKALTTDLSTAVASYLGLTMTITLDGHDVSFTVRQDPVTSPELATSLLIPLAAATPSDAASTLLLYAATPAAFVDLAADLAYALKIDPSNLIIDEHLDAPDTHAGMSGLDGLSTISQAIGVLIGQGHTPEAAHAELHRLANLDHGRSPRSRQAGSGRHPAPTGHRRHSSPAMTAAKLTVQEHHRVAQDRRTQPSTSPAVTHTDNDLCTKPSHSSHVCRRRPCPQRVPANTLVRTSRQPTFRAGDVTVGHD